MSEAHAVAEVLEHMASLPTESERIAFVERLPIEAQAAILQAVAPDEERASAGAVGQMVAALEDVDRQMITFDSGLGRPMTDAEAQGLTDVLTEQFADGIVLNVARAWRSYTERTGAPA